MMQKAQRRSEKLNRKKSLSLALFNTILLMISFYHVLCESIPDIMQKFDDRTGQHHDKQFSNVKLMLNFSK